MAKALCILVAWVLLASFAPSKHIATHTTVRLTRWEGNAPIERTERTWDETTPECAPTNGWHVCT